MSNWFKRHPVIHLLAVGVCLATGMWPLAAALMLIDEPKKGGKRCR